MVDCFYRLYNNIYSLYQLNSNNTFLVTMTKIISITCQMPPKEQNLPQYSTTDINDYKEPCYFNHDYSVFKTWLPGYPSSYASRCQRNRAGEPNMRDFYGQCVKVAQLPFTHIPLDMLNHIGCRHSVTMSCPTHWDPTNYSTLGSPVLHYLPGFSQIHDNWVGDDN